MIMNKKSFWIGVLTGVVAIFAIDFGVPML